MSVTCCFAAPNLSHHLHVPAASRDADCEPSRPSSHCSTIRLLRFHQRVPDHRLAYSTRLPVRQDVRSNTEPDSQANVVRHSA
jgi:hypothetical protein